MLADAGFGEGDGGVDAAIVELDALADADGAAADDEGFLPVEWWRFVFLVVGAVVVGV